MLERINRYIMECKYLAWAREQEFVEELIDTLWNVNLLLDIISQHKAIELIDTLWNVNTTPRSFVSDGILELIDTLWNVNKQKRMRGGGNAKGINRYIMECKLGNL